MTEKSEHLPGAVVNKVEQASAHRLDTLAHFIINRATEALGRPLTECEQATMIGHVVARWLFRGVFNHCALHHKQDGIEGVADRWWNVAMPPFKEWFAVVHRVLPAELSIEINVQVQEITKPPGEKAN